MPKIVDLLDDAMNGPEYEERVSFLVGGLVSEFANDTPEQEAANRAYLKEISDYCRKYTGEHEDFARRISKKNRKVPGVMMDENKKMQELWEGI